MYSNEILFVEKFLAELTMMHVSSIPFKTARYRAGVMAMKDYYQEHMDQLGDGLEDIGLLFIGNGEKDFATALMSVNGKDISLKNPYLENATLQMSESTARFSLEDDELAIPSSFMKEITLAFYNAAFAEN